VPRRGVCNSRDYVLDNDEEAMVIQHVAVILEAEACVLPPRGGGHHPARARVRGGVEGGRGRRPPPHPPPRIEAPVGPNFVHRRSRSGGTTYM
jgi:hypothetical protein